jgi:hypothetical protein
MHIAQCPPTGIKSRHFCHVFYPIRALETLLECQYEDLFYEKEDKKSGSRQVNDVSRSQSRCEAGRGAPVMRKKG